MHNGNDIINALMIPSILNYNGIHIELKTNYPFENSFKYLIESDKDFNFFVRIPSFAKNLTVNNIKAETNDLLFEIKSGDKKEIIISFETTPFIEKRPLGLNVAKCGSLLFALPIQYEKNMLEYERDGVERKYPYCDYEYIPKSDWNYGFASNELEIEYNQLSKVPFSSENPPIVLNATLKKIDWGFEDGYDTVCAKIPQSKKAISNAVNVKLYPYGCAKLRMTELPFVE